MRTTLQTLQAMKADGRRFVMVTAYDFASAAIADRAGVPAILVGDSLGMVMLGFETTVPVTLDDVVRSAAAVARAARTALVVADLPFLTYSDQAAAVAAAARLMQEGGAHAVKLEGAGPIVPVVAHLTSLGVPVVGHLGYTPQSTHRTGVKMQGKEPKDAEALFGDAVALEAAGASALVLELVPDALSARIRERLRIPVIGIGAGPDCDGQVQVWHDLLGLYGEKTPRHAKRYADLGAAAVEALKSYAHEVALGEFPPRRS